MGRVVVAVAVSAMIAAILMMIVNVFAAEKMAQAHIKEEQFWVRDLSDYQFYFAPKSVMEPKEPKCPQDDNPCTIDQWDGFECMRVFNITCENQRR